MVFGVTIKPRIIDIIVKLIKRTMSEKVFNSSSLRLYNGRIKIKIKFRIYYRVMAYRVQWPRWKNTNSVGLIH